MKNLLKILASVKITGFCLLWLFVLTFWGTVAQVSQGLYAAQERFFFSVFFLVGGIFPFLGAQGVLWILFINLCASSVVHFSKIKTWRSIGLKISHGGVLIYFVAAFATFHLSEESSVHLMEGESTNVGTSYNEWEIASFKVGTGQRLVKAIDLKGLKVGSSIELNGTHIYIEQIYWNCSAFVSKKGRGILNASGIDVLQPLEINKEREKNLAGGIFKINNQTVLLYGDEIKPTKVGEKYFHLRHKKFPLPFTLKLKKFI